MGLTESPEVAPRKDTTVLVLFTATTFTASALLFLVQPLFAKMALPHLGGSPSVWNTCVLFFQATLLLAYLYAHLSVRWLGVRGQAICHIVVLLLPLVALPVGMPAGGPPQGEDPTWWLLRTMAARVGLPFFAVATMAPLVQRWLSTLPLRSARDPYFLYAASNLGSMLSLLAFPFLLEPAFGIRKQALGWVGGYLVLVGLAVICSITTWKWGSATAVAPRVVGSGRVGARDRVRWVLLSFVPSSLMLGVTAHISTDLAAVPLLWIIPLCLYLATFIIAFSRHPWIPDRLADTALPILALAAVASIFLRIGSPYMIGLHLAAFFACALVCHIRLARSRPSTQHLTEFYLWLSVGGALGGTFNTLIAPHVFNGVYEYGLVLALGCLMRPGSASNRRVEPWPVFAVSGVVPLVVSTGAWASGAAPPGVTLVQALLIALLVIGAFWSVAHRRAPANAVILGVALLPLTGFADRVGEIIFSDRSFFGVLKVIETGPGLHVLQHGTTLHGRQDLRVPSSCDPLSYYHRRGPIGQVFADSRVGVQDIAVVGLGTGALACYAAPGGRVTFFEIDPMVETIARNPRLFTYLRNSPGAVETRIGDGRKLLERASPASYDLLILDAFSSDAVPVHLMTREALRSYASKLRPAGALAFHISNRYLDLESVLSEAASAENLFAIANRDVSVSADDQDQGRSPSHWVLIAREERLLGLMLGRPGWLSLAKTDGAHAWTDDYSNIIDALILDKR